MLENQGNPMIFRKVGRPQEPGSKQLDDAKDEIEMWFHKGLTQAEIKDKLRDTVSASDGQWKRKFEKWGFRTNGKDASAGRKAAKKAHKLRSQQNPRPAFPPVPIAPPVGNSNSQASSSSYPATYSQQDPMLNMLVSPLGHQDYHQTLGHGGVANDNITGILEDTNTNFEAGMMPHLSNEERAVLAELQLQSQANPMAFSQQMYSVPISHDKQTETSLVQALHNNVSSSSVGYRVVGGSNPLRETGQEEDVSYSDIAGLKDSDFTLFDLPEDDE